MKASDSVWKEGATDLSAGFGRLAVEMLERTLPVHPLMAPPVAAMAAATAIGFGFSTQMAGAFLGAMQGALDATHRLAEALDDTPPEEPKSEEPKPEVRIRPEHIRPPAMKKAKLSVVPAAEHKAPAPRQPAAPKKPAVRAKKADDLKRIAGIGPKLEQVLNARGVRTFAEIAAWTDADTARIDAELDFDGRIARDDWTGQAKALVAKGRKRT
jgi:NADH-quinone oxidoreductase subunit E